MKVERLALNAAGQHGFTHQARITYADFAAMTGGTTGTLNVFPDDGTLNSPAGQIIEKAALRVITPVTHASTFTVSLGDSSTGAAANMAAKDVKAAAATWYTGTYTPNVIPTTVALRITCTVGAGTPSTASAGDMLLLMRIVDGEGIYNN